MIFENIIFLHSKTSQPSTFGLSSRLQIARSVKMSTQVIRQHLAREERVETPSLLVSCKSKKIANTLLLCGLLKKQKEDGQWQYTMKVEPTGSRADSCTITTFLNIVVTISHFLPESNIMVIRFSGPLLVYFQQLVSFQSVWSKQIEDPRNFILSMLNYP